MLRMTRFFFPLLLLASMAACGEYEAATYQAKLAGEFGDNGEHTADFSFAVDRASESFTGVVYNFQTDRAGFDAPDGAIQVTGTSSLNEEGAILLVGDGEGVLSQGDLTYEVNIHLESGWVQEQLKTVSGWYSGGGGLLDDGNYQEWISYRGKFRVQAECREDNLRINRCAERQVLPEIPTK
ncbi:hypothetical protein [Silicimonas sp. MF1-12-2]|uniref:hypothetical protein n=1 Tax=Silicimonas sp. MF1-12-2 TaxID=3384793 RepID=UPI0039B66A61